MVLESDGTVSSRVEYSMDRRRNWEILEEPERLARVNVMLEMPGFNRRTFHYEGKQESGAVGDDQRANRSDDDETESESDDGGEGKSEEKLTRAEKKDRKKENRAHVAKVVVRGVNAEIEARDLKDNSKEKRKKERQDLAKTSHKARQGHKRLDVAENYYLQRDSEWLASRLELQVAESGSAEDGHDDGVNRSNTRAARRQAEKKLAALERRKESSEANSRAASREKMKNGALNVNENNVPSDDSTGDGDFDSDWTLSDSEEKEAILLTSQSLTPRLRAKFICDQCRDGYFRENWYSRKTEQRNKKSRQRQKRGECEGDYDVHLEKGKRRPDDY